MSKQRDAAVLRHLAAAARREDTAWLPAGLSPEDAATALEAGAAALAPPPGDKKTGGGRRRAPERSGPASEPDALGPAKSVRIHVDGASRGNPGPAGFGAILEGIPDGPCLVHSGYLGETTNNVAEYQALLWALAEARRRGFDAAEVRSDSELMVKQMRGEYRVKHPRLHALHAQATALARGFGTFSIRYVPREQNAAADALANRAIDEQGLTAASRRGAAAAAG